MIDPRFVVNLRGKDYATWPGVLDAATKAGLRSLVTTIVQIPAPENGHVAVVMARAEFEDGRTFEDVGDASPANCSPQIAAASLRMASTRAKGRVLRDALNIGQTLFEELPAGLDDYDDTPAPTPETPRNGSAPAGCADCGRRLTAGQQTMSRQRFGRPLCPKCQRGGVRR